MRYEVIKIFPGGKYKAIITDNTRLISSSRHGIIPVTVCQVIDIQDAEEIAGILNICDGYTVKEIEKIVGYTVKEMDAAVTRSK